MKRREVGRKGSQKRNCQRKGCKEKKIKKETVKRMKCQETAVTRRKRSTKVCQVSFRAVKRKSKTCQDMSRYVKGKPEKVETSEKDMPSRKRCQGERDAKEKETSVYLNKVKTDNGFGIQWHPCDLASFLLAFPIVTSAAWLARALLVSTGIYSLGLPSQLKVTFISTRP